MRAKPKVQLHPPCTVKNTCPDTMKGVTWCDRVTDLFTVISFCQFEFFGAYEVMTSDFQ